VKSWTVLAALATACALAPASNAAAEQRLMQCDSNGYRYPYCNADTQGRGVLLREISTGNLCRQGRGWGFDDNGIWVDKGCRGEFRFGEDSSKRNDGAISSSQQKEPPPPPKPAAGSVPSWAPGSYTAFDPETSDNVLQWVRGSGEVTLRDGMIYWRNGKRSWFAREGPGVLIGDIDPNRHYYFRRGT
jgi:hypothetical protein